MNKVLTIIGLVMAVEATAFAEEPNCPNEIPMKDVGVGAPDWTAVCPMISEDGKRVAVRRYWSSAADEWYQRLEVYRVRTGKVLRDITFSARGYTQEDTRKSVYQVNALLKRGTFRPMESISIGDEGIQLESAKTHLRLRFAMASLVWTKKVNRIRVQGFGCCGLDDWQAECDLETTIGGAWFDRKSRALIVSLIPAEEPCLCYPETEVVVGRAMRISSSGLSSQRK